MVQFSSKLLFIVFLLLVTPRAFSQENPNELPNGLFKPEFIMSNQQQLQLTDQQRQSIMKEVTALQAKAPQLPDGPEKMKLFLGTVTRINAVLTPEQKEKLKTLGRPGTADLHPLFTNPVRVEIQGYKDFAAKEPFISRDGQYLFFNNTNDKPGVDTHVFYAKRIDDATFQFIGPVEGLGGEMRVPDLNSAAPSLDADGNIYFTSTKSYRNDFNVIHQGLFNKGVVTGVSAVPGISLKKFGWINMDGEISADGKTLYYSDTLASDSSKVSILRVAAKNADGSFTPLPNSDDLLKTANNVDVFNYAPSTTVDGLELFFTSGMATGIYVVKRSSISEPFGPAQLAVAATNGNVEAPSITDDGKHLYYAQQEGEEYFWTIYVATRSGS